MMSLRDAEIRARLAIASLTSGTGRDALSTANQLRFTCMGPRRATEPRSSMHNAHPDHA